METCMVNENDSQRKVAIWIWSRGGGGHKMAKVAVQQKMCEEYQKKGIELDCTHDYDIMGKRFLNSIYIPIIGRFGDLLARLWDGTQEKGDIKGQKLFASLQVIGEKFIFDPIIYYKNKKRPKKIGQRTRAYCQYAKLMHPFHY